VFTTITRIIARAVFTFFSTSNLICAQIHRVWNLRYEQQEFLSCLAHFKLSAFACYREAAHPPATDHQSPFKVVAAALGESSALREFSVLG
jgi:hypothetical protein